MIFKEENDTKMNIQEALVLMIDAFRNCENEQKNALLIDVIVKRASVCL